LKGMKRRYFSGVFFGCDQVLNQVLLKSKPKVMWSALHCNIEIYNINNEVEHNF